MSLLKTNEIQNYNGSSLTLTASTVSTSAQLNTGGNISVTGSLNVSDDSTTRTNLGLGTIATQDSDSITVTGGTATLGALTVSGSDSGDLVRITQTGSGNALVVEDSTNPDSSPFVVDSSGKVGIGQTPTTKLDVYSAGFVAAQISGDSTSEAQLIFDGNTAVRINNKSNTSLIFATNATERMRIDSSGAITMPDVYNDIVTGRDLQINSFGQLGYSPSVRESKTNIEDLPSIDWLYQLNPVKFQYRLKDEDENYTDEADPEIQYGLIAEDVAEINPDLVFGDETENGFELRGIQYSRLTAPMIKAIQEQQALIESQQSQIDALTARIVALETT